ncbi:3-phosphoshikimate 1-carboxyvinyltransferase [Blattabacterium cuenoti]|uniref:3-phosphoshikimate 1-carboxyvinyltransferase n=1 Tax=Blattabacterium cuenoti TaxID=1653831 RepID=UPI00163B84D0|nr:3-phosphoshikimate 1-carboxyvinyltransferase [Blattabacterium cuenoti]
MSNNINIYRKTNCLNGSISITGSKSISNRLLIIKYLYKENINIENLSNCDDTKVLENSLKNEYDVINIHHAGTAMRFLTSYLAIKENKTTILTGSSRMKQRPISILVNALKKLGAKIIYLEKIGYPPLKIFGKSISGGEIYVNAKVSSQYISSLMLVANKFKNGLKIFLENKITSIPYIKMTFDLLSLSGIEIIWKEKYIHIFPYKKKGKKVFHIESDWSSASYYYSMATVSKKSNIMLSSYFNKSLQGDKEVSYLYEKYFGILTFFIKNKIFLKKKDNFYQKKFIKLNLNKTPDLAQTIIVTCASIGIKCYINGLETLKIKETDRLAALQNELYKFGIIVNITKSHLEIKDFIKKNIKYPIEINTYQDHRMAMSFIPFTLLNNFPILKIKEPNVVKKSYPSFWNDLKSIGFIIMNNDKV